MTSIPSLLTQIARLLNTLPTHHPYAFSIFEPLPSNHDPKNRSTTKYYCDLCKKSFASQATWTTHQSKHRAKRTTPPPTLCPPKANSLGDVLTKLKWAKNIELTTPSVAQTVYWNIANALWSKYADPRDTGVALSLLLGLLYREKSVDSKTPTLLALARLLIVCGGPSDIATQLRIHALPFDTVPDTSPNSVRQFAWHGWSGPQIHELASWFLANGQCQLAVYLLAVRCCLLPTQDTVCDFIEALVSHNRYVDVVSWVLEFLGSPHTFKKVAGYLILEGMISARTLGDRVSVKLLYAYAIEFDFDTAVEIKFLLHTSCRQCPPLQWRLIAGKLLSQVKSYIAVGKKRHALRSGADLSVCVRIIDHQMWDNVQLGRWEGLVHKIAAECGISA